MTSAGDAKATPTPKRSKVVVVIVASVAVVLAGSFFFWKRHETGVKRERLEARLAKYHGRVFAERRADTSHFDFVSFSQEFPCMLGFCFKIVVINVRFDFDLFNLHLMLRLLALFFPFGLIIGKT